MQLYTHLTRYAVPKLQRYAIRVVCIIPVYCVNSFFAVYFSNYAFYFDTMKEMYEGFVVYNFLSLCIASVGYESDLVDYWARNGNPAIPSSWMFCTCCLESVPMDARFLRLCKQGVLQFVLVKVLMAVVIFICSAFGVYTIGNLSANNGYIWIFIIYNIAYTMALYFLLLFYLSAHDLLKPYKPVMKFVLVKLIIFLTFWQSIFVSLSFSTVGDSSGCSLSVSEFQGRFQNFLMVCECVPFAFLNLIYFSPADFHGELANNFVLPPTPITKSLPHLLSVYDIWMDICHSFGFAYAEYTLNRDATAADMADQFEPKVLELWNPFEIDMKEQNRLDVEMENVPKEVSNDAYDMRAITNPEIPIAAATENSFHFFTK